MIRALSCAISLCALIGLAQVASAQAPPPGLDPHLEPLRPLLGKTWRSKFPNSTPDRPLVDVMRWEQALNGKAVRLRHSINDGMYGGETIFRWDEPRQTVTYYYFTTAGFMTTGTAAFKDGVIETLETVGGNAGGVTEVRGKSKLEADGTFHVATEAKNNGTWEAGPTRIYKEDPNARVRFRDDAPAPAGSTSPAPATSP
jgi:hypothetical protein